MSGLNTDNRRKTRRSRNGCIQCKRRKIKCDETEPECSQCTKKAHVCPGYVKPTQWSTKHERYPQVAPSVDDSHIPLGDGIGHTGIDDAAGPVASERPSFLGDPDTSFWLTNSEVPLVDLTRVTSITLHDDPSNLYPLSATFRADRMTLDRASTEEVTVARPTVMPLALPQLQQIEHSVHQSPSLHPDNNTWMQLVESHEPFPIPLIPQPTHVPTMLIEYWFRRVCPILSAFDSKKNPFRAIAFQLWDDSSCLYYTMLSMSASCLNEQLPHLSSVRLAARTRAAAQQSLQEDLQKFHSTSSIRRADNILMACFLLGSSASWIDGQDVGLNYFQTAQDVLGAINPDSSTVSVPGYEVHSFFQETFIYWEMLIHAAGAVDAHQKEQFSSEVNGSTLYTPGRALGLSRRGLANKVMPHPLTASATPALNLLARTLSLTRQQRLLHRNGDFSTRSDLEKALSNIETAKTLEHMLVQLTPPEVEEICDTDDEATPASHFVLLAESTRLVALLQLYRTFPDLLADALWQREHDDVESTTSLALSVVGNLAQVPPTSGVRCMIPIILVMLSDGLRFQTPPNEEQMPELNDWYIPAQDLRVARARTFVLDRLHCFERCLPARPVQQALNLVREVWTRLDDGKNDFWMEVMLDSALTTVFC